MASFTFSSVGDLFGVGTSVGAYLPNPIPGASSPVTGAAVTTATVAADGSLAFSGLVDDTAYVAYDSGSGKSRRFRSQPLVASGSQSIPVANVTGDAAAITAALTSITTGGKANGRLATTQGRVARISTPTVLDLGYANTQDATTWDVDHTEKVKLSLDILPDAGLGAALTIKGGYGVELDLNVLGGGQRGTGTADATNGSTTVSNAAALITAGLKAGAVVFIAGAGQQPEGVAQPLAASVRSVNVAAGTFVVSEAAGATAAGAAVTWFDVAVRLEDHVGLKLNIYGESYEGCLVAADATDDVTKRMRSVSFGRIHGNSCGRTIFWKSMEAHGSLGQIWSNSYYGDYFGICADLHWTHYEGGVGPAVNLADTYLWLDRCTQVNNLSVSVGDRATEALVKITADSTGNTANVGRFSQIRCTGYLATATGDIANTSNQITNVLRAALTMRAGQTISGPGIPVGTTILSVTGSLDAGTAVITMSATATATALAQTVYGHATDGPKLIGVQSIEIDTLDTASCIAGLRVVGGGGNGIRVKRHVSLTSDFNPLVIEPGAAITSPRVYVGCDWRQMRKEAALVKAGVVGGKLRLFGHIDTPNAQGYASTYAVDCLSAAFEVDVAELTQPNRAVLAGSVHHADPTKVYGVARARLGNATGTVHGAAPTTTRPSGISAWASNVGQQNTSDRVLNVAILVRFQPTSGVDATFTPNMAPQNSGYISLGSVYKKFKTVNADTPNDETVLHTFRLLPGWWLSMGLLACTITRDTYWYE